MPKDRVTMLHQGYGFVEFLTEEDADYAIKIMNMIKLFGKPIRVNKASAHQKNLDVGANIFIGNLDPEVDEKLLYDTFSAFGVILTTPKVSRVASVIIKKNFIYKTLVKIHLGYYGVFTQSDRYSYDLMDCVPRPLNFTIPPLNSQLSVVPKPRDSFTYSTELIRKARKGSDV
jgi:RNA recognition motif-containing protein